MSPLPIGLPLPTALYTTLFVLTLALSMTFANYVLGGALWLCARALLGRGTQKAEVKPSAIDATLRDWLTFMLSGAITAGVAPLLFVQVLYQREFYTANLLLWYWWLAMIPVLIAAFYALYAVKTRYVSARPLVMGLTTLFAAACFVYVAWAWTHNHLLSTESQEVWSATYAARSSGPTPPGQLARLMFFVFASVPGMAVIVAWQLRDQERAAGALRQIAERRILSAAAAISLVFSIAFALLYSRLDPVARSAAASDPSLWWLILALLGALGQLVTWHRIFRAPAFSGRLLVHVTLYYAFWLIGLLFVREVIRRSLFAPETLAALQEKHSEIFETTDHSAMVVFFVFAALTLGLMTWIVRTVRRSVAAAR